MPRYRVSKSSLLSGFCCVTSCTSFLLLPGYFAGSMDPTARGASVLRTRPGAPLAALEEKPDERQEIRQLHSSRLQERVGVKDKKTEIHVRFHAHDYRHGNETQDP